MAAKKSGILDWCRDFCNWCISSTLRHNALHSHTRHWSTDWNSGGATCIECYVQPDMLCLTLPVCDVIIVTTISPTLHAVASDVIIIPNVHWWWWAHLCCKLPNLTQKPVNALTEHNSLEVQKNLDYEMWKEQVLSEIGEDPD